MKNQEYDVLDVEGGSPVKMWTRGVPVEAEAKQQLSNMAKMPFIYKHVAVMPDVHVGKGSTIGSVIPTLGAIIPAAVGVDIGCGMMAAKTTLTANDLPDNLGRCAARLKGPCRTAPRRSCAASAAATKVRGTRRHSRSTWPGPRCTKSSTPSAPRRPS